MSRKSEEPLKQYKINLFDGDWGRLAALLHPTGIPTGTFLRALVRKKILQLEAARNDIARPVGDIDADELIRTIEQPQ